MVGLCDLFLVDCGFGVVGWWCGCVWYLDGYLCCGVVVVCVGYDVVCVVGLLVYVGGVFGFVLFCEYWCDDGDL